MQFIQMQNNHTILAIDPGYDRCGVAVISVSGRHGTLLHSECVTTLKTQSQEVRLAHVYKSLEAVVKEWKPTHLAIETIFFSVNKKSAMKVAEARGVVMLLAGLHNLELVELSPQAVKLGMTGIGNSDKKAVQKMVGLTLKINLDDKLDDEIDAIALGFASIGSLKKLS